jgi:hypothetical protein
MDTEWGLKFKPRISKGLRPLSQTQTRIRELSRVEKKNWIVAHNMIKLQLES